MQTYFRFYFYTEIFVHIFYSDAFKNLENDIRSGFLKYFFLFLTFRIVF